MSHALASPFDGVGLRYCFDDFDGRALWRAHAAAHLVTCDTGKTERVKSPSMISPDIALARAWYERQRTLDRLTHQVGLRSWLAARADRVEAIVRSCFGAPPAPLSAANALV
jgi:hypothetical protein